ncbi:uncharacterized protein LOC110929463 [Helianthus annuus]|uniref:uncharacterized protein LOC110929463 n=1 Tax=Helianthus annuus TaxID=4232 RepID=UPI000B8F276D|nr:uncharacterized protein LOC110929463 [Helianthus annuus]
MTTLFGSTTLFGQEESSGGSKDQSYDHYIDITAGGAFNSDSYSPNNAFTANGENRYLTTSHRILLQKSQSGFHMRLIASLMLVRLFAFSLGDLDHLHGVLCLLRNSPNLEASLMKLIQTESELMHHGVEATLNYLESPDCLDQTLNRLRTVELSHLQGSKPELLFIKLLLAHSPSLEKFTIQANGALDGNKRFKIAKDVMRFPRASSKAEMFYLDPKSCKNV